jgi:23S rRNA maturation mini-RNase III
MDRFEPRVYKENLGGSRRIFLAFLGSLIYEIIVRRKVPGREEFRRSHLLGESCGMMIAVQRALFQDFS